MIPAKNKNTLIRLVNGNWIFCRDASMIPAKKIKKTLIRLENGNWKLDAETDAEKICENSRDTWSRLQFYREFLQSFIEHIRRNCIGDILRNDVKKSFLDVIVSYNQRNLSVRLRIYDRSYISLLLFRQ